MSEKQYNWAYFWELVRACPKFTLFLFVFLGMVLFYLSFFYEGMTFFYSVLKVIGGLILLIPVKAGFTGMIRDVNIKKRVTLLRFEMFLLWRALLFALLAGVFLFPVMSESFDETPPSIEEQP